MEPTMGADSVESESSGTADRRPRFLIVESDDECISHLRQALRPVCSVQVRNGAHSPPPKGRSTCDVVGSIAELHEYDLSALELVICAVNLPDGSGLDALAFLRGMRQDLAVLVTGMPEDAPIAVEAIRAGATDFIVVPSHDLKTLPLTVEKCLAHQRIKHENDRLQRELSHSLAELEVKNRQLESVIRQLEVMARTDELTSLANRRWLNLMMTGMWAEATRHDLPLALAMMDLDGFKALNDTCGHQRGDEMLRMVGKVLEANCREVDVCARFGGDEFCILMPHTEPHEAVLVADRVMREFKLAIDRLPADEPRVSLSVGIAHIDLSRPVNADQLVTHADEAMYAAKASGKNRVIVRDSEGVYAPLGEP